MLETGISMEKYAGLESEPGAETRREQVMELAAGQRLELFQNVFVSYGSGDDDSQFRRKAPNLIPGVGDAIMAFKALRGKEYGKSIPRSQRLLYGAAAATEALSLVLAYKGHYVEAGSAHFISEMLSKGDAILPIIKSGVSLAAERSPKLARVMEASGQWLTASKERLPKLQELMGNIYAGE